jgi:hypothetical protein
MDKSMSHIPEDELHAYLDQALGRSRCVEIESHLAECTRCRDARDGIAALRDRTTALLARLAPRRTTVPPYAELRRRAQLRLFRQQRIFTRLAWAASVVLALGIGWTASTLYRAPSAASPLASAPVRTPAPATAQPAAASSPEQPALVQPRPVAAPAPSSTPSVERRLVATPAVRRPEPALPASPGWRTVAWDATPGRAVEPLGASAEPAPVAPAPPGVVVTRRLASGEVVRAVDGSPTDVSSLLSGRPLASSEAKAAAPAMPPAYGAGSLALRQGGVAMGTSGVPSDSLRAMMRRLNLMLRVR